MYICVYRITVTRQKYRFSLIQTDLILSSADF